MQIPFVCHKGLAVRFRKNSPRRSCSTIDSRIQPSGRYGNFAGLFRKFPEHPRSSIAPLVAAGESSLVSGMARNRGWKRDTHSARIYLLACHSGPGGHSYSRIALRQRSLSMGMENNSRNHYSLVPPACLDPIEESPCFIMPSMRIPKRYRGKRATLLLLRMSGIRPASTFSSCWRYWPVFLGKRFFWEDFFIQEYPSGNTASIWSGGRMRFRSGTHTPGRGRRSWPMPKAAFGTRQTYCKSDWPGSFPRMPFISRFSFQRR